MNLLPGFPCALVLFCSLALVVKTGTQSARSFPQRPLRNLNFFDHVKSVVSSGNEKIKLLLSYLLDFLVPLCSCGNKQERRVRGVFRKGR